MTTLSVISLAEAENEIGVDPGSRPLLAAYVVSVSRLLDKACGPIVKRTVTDESHDGGSTFIILDHFPVLSVTSVTEYQGTSAVSLTEETPTTSPSQGFLLGRGGMLHRRSGKCDWMFYRGRSNVVVTYVAGRYDDTASVDERFKRAALITLRNLWSKEQGMGTVTFGPDGAPIVGATYALPNAAKAFIQDDLLASGHAA